MKPINKKYFEHYLIDTHGNVYSTISGHGVSWKNGIKQIKTWPNKNTAYHQVVLQNRKMGIKPTCFYVHRLVAETYIPNPNNLPEVNHIIADKNDNSVGNLEWVTTEDNIKHALLFGKRSSVPRKPHKVVNTKLLRLDKKLMKEGIKHYIKHKNFNYLSKLWNISITSVKKILKKEGKLQTSSYIKLSTETKELIINDLKITNEKIGPKYFKKLNQKFNIKISNWNYYNIIKQYKL